MAPIPMNGFRQAPLYSKGQFWLTPCAAFSGVRIELLVRFPR